MPAKRETFPPLDLRKIRADQAANALQRAYLLLGKDRFLKERMLNQLAAAGGEVILARAPEETERLVEQLSTYPMFDGTLVGMLKHTETLVGPAWKKAKQRLLGYLANPSSWAVVLLDFDDSNLSPAGRALRTALSPLAAPLVSGPVSRDQARRWIEQRLANGRVDARIIDFLWDRTQGQLQALDSEVAKLEMAAADGLPVTLDDCRWLVTTDERDEPFELTQAIQDGQPDAALRALHRTLAHSTDAHMVLGGLAAFVRSVVLVAAALDRGETQQAISTQFGYHAYRVKQLATVARRTPMRRLLRLVAALAVADRRTKLGADPVPVLERLVIGLTWSGRGGR